MTRSIRELTRTYAEPVDPWESDHDRPFETDRRTMTIDVLLGRRGPVELADLAAGIAARENGVDETDAETVDRVALALHHVHLPRLADWGIIDYDPAANRIESCPRRHDAGIE
ncbi:DUF7344 domain-containing protein [Halosolutus halophilus]|uniref:DUF7344 domain-containing protein n=1 Tax=Halosolutus halophilus TaxID=1552990 RepID=UPI0022352D69|nr:hypothetical protein [Halosolutus halophilus]